MHFAVRDVEGVAKLRLSVQPLFQDDRGGNPCLIAQEYPSSLLSGRGEYEESLFNLRKRCLSGAFQGYDPAFRSETIGLPGNLVAFFLLLSILCL